ncbi:nitrogen fixation protein NifQ [Tolumonas lignilytica]|uniref:nitrogen fixation protein NifQ n=1 Tax=Tolumonas lignilytica TaxID=1283284 RepID=UPI000465D989|nr:nitrogen fixation protein NifQ [Tolumonas lignilytica]
MNQAIRVNMPLDVITPEHEQPRTPQDWLTDLLWRFQTGICPLPRYMGLGTEQYQQLLVRCNVPSAVMGLLQQQRQAVLSELLAMREAECQALEHWLAEYAHPEARLMARIIAVACMGYNHLWQDLGLDSRASLRELMQCCFPELVEMNSQNMRWKKFFYRQQCALGGNYVCRSPSCDDCVERAGCFAPEE